MSDTTRPGSAWPHRITVTLCGSTRFKSQFEAVTRELTLAGVIVLAPGVFGHSISLAPGQKAALDLLHLAKIDRSDAVLVVNPRCYLGKSTCAEIVYATHRGLPVAYTTRQDGWLTRCTSCDDPDDLSADVGTYREAIGLAGAHEDAHHFGDPTVAVEARYVDTFPLSTDLFTTPTAAPTGDTATV